MWRAQTECTKRIRDALSKRACGSHDVQDNFLFKAAEWFLLLDLFLEMACQSFSVEVIEKYNDYRCNGNCARDGRCWLLLRGRNPSPCIDHRLSDSPDRNVRLIVDGVTHVDVLLG